MGALAGVLARLTPEAVVEQAPVVLDRRTVDLSGTQEPFPPWEEGFGGFHPGWVRRPVWVLGWVGWVIPAARAVFMGHGRMLPCPKREGEEHCSSPCNGPSRSRTGVHEASRLECLWPCPCFGQLPFDAHWTGFSGRRGCRVFIPFSRHRIRGLSDFIGESDHRQRGGVRQGFQPLRFLGREAGSGNVIVVRVSCHLACLRCARQQRPQLFLRQLPVETVLGPCVSHYLASVMPPCQPQGA